MPVQQNRAPASSAGSPLMRHRLPGSHPGPGAPAGSPAGNRPRGVTALACLFALGVLASGSSAISLLDPGGVLEPMWRLNPRVRESFARMGGWAPLLLAVVCAGCAACAYGFFTGRRWAYPLGVGGLIVNLAGDITNAALGIEPRAVVGVPIVALILWYLSSRRVRSYFGRTEKAS